MVPSLETTKGGQDTMLALSAEMRARIEQAIQNPTIVRTGSGFKIIELPESDFANRVVILWDQRKAPKTIPPGLTVWPFMMKGHVGWIASRPDAMRFEAA